MDIGKLVLLGAAGYVGYRYFMAPPAGASVSPAPAGGYVAVGEPAPAPPTPSPAANPLTTAGLVQAAASRDGLQMGTPDQWGYYYGTARGVSAPAPEELGFTGDGRFQLLTFDEWWGTASSNGLAGGYHRARF